MSPQFKKFLLFLTSIGLGVLIYNLLYLIHDPNKDLFAAPMVAFLYMILSIMGMFIFYRYFRKNFLRS